MNQTVICGGLGRDPELKYTQSGKSVCVLRVATSEKYTRRDGERVENTEWHNVTVWGDPAEGIAEKARKGCRVVVIGKKKTEEYTDRDGMQQKVTKIEVSFPFGTVGIVPKAEKITEKITDKEEEGFDLPF